MGDRFYNISNEMQKFHCKKVYFPREKNSIRHYDLPKN